MLLALSMVPTIIAKPHQPQQDRIVGGQIVEPNQFLHFVSFRILDLVIPHFCSGTIITRHFILTTAICINERTDPARITLVVGTQHMQEVGQRHRIANVIRHPQFTGNVTDFLSNNLAIVETEKPIEFNERVQPARIYLREIDPEQLVSMPGWHEVIKHFSSINEIHY